MESTLPVIVIGAGPQGLAAAAHLVERDVPVVVLEAGDGPAAAVRECTAALVALVDVTLAVDEHAPCVDSACTVAGCCGTGADA
ncbi:hypothetical protein RU09_11985 [Microbacterium sp. MEJ108Y]|nr:hypothetical protein RU09_11985 [Microbacterium sp. MEJ108Y]